MRNVNIREIQQSDDPAIAKVIRDVLIEHDVPRTGTAFADPELDHMFETYNRPGSVYFVVELDGAIVGGAGVAPLANQNENICELQKMYFLPEARGLGIGNTMMEKCLIEAKKLGYEKCYLETMEYMKPARGLYVKSGFRYLDGPMGDTGHYQCPVWMLRDL